MKKAFLFFIFCFALNAILNAQTLSQTLQVGVQYGPTPFETMDGLGGCIGYEAAVNRFISASAVLGFVGGSYQVKGMSKGQDANGSWDNQYAYRLQEQFNYLDVTGLVNATPNSKRNRLEIGLGIGLTHTVLKYPKDLYIEKGLIENLVYTKHHEVVAMAHLTFANRVKITPRLECFARLTGRQAFKESPVLERSVGSGNVSFSSANNVKNNYTISLGMGYYLSKLKA